MGKCIFLSSNTFTERNKESAFYWVFLENKSKGSAVATMGNGNSISFFFKANKRTCIYIYIYGIISQDVPLIPSQKSYTSILQIHKTEFGSS